MFINQAFRFVFGRLLKKKHEAVHRLDELTSTVANQVADTRIGRLVTDSGGSTQAMSSVPAAKPAGSSNYLTTPTHQKKTTLWRRRTSTSSTKFGP